MKASGWVKGGLSRLLNRIPRRDRVKVVNRSFLFASLSGITTHYADMPGYALLRPQLEQMCHAIHTHGGEMVKLVENGVQASFDTPADALRCALAIQQAATRYSPVDSERARYGRRVRIGLGSGDCIRFLLHNRVDYFGRVVDVAAILARKGGDDEILMTRGFRFDDNVQQLLEPLHLVAEYLQLPGFRGNSEVYRLRWRSLDGVRGRGYWPVSANAVPPV